MTAAEIALALGGGRREGRNWRVPCPLHGGKSLALADGRGGLLVHCWGGCEARDILAELYHRGLIDDGGEADPGRTLDLRKRAAVAAKAEAERVRRRIDGPRAVYGRGQPAASSPVEAYLRSRGITIPVPPVLRWLPHCLHRNGHYYPAMVAPIVDISGEQTGVHKTFLRLDGSGKADLPKEEQRETCGPMKGCAVRLGPVHANQWLSVGEGIESVLSAMQLWGLSSGWAALSEGGLRNLVLPPEAHRIVIAVDNDANGVGQAAARDAAWLWTEAGQAVRVMVPPHADADFNDVLMIGF